MTITKSITIDCTGTIGSILNSSVNGVNINDSATATPNTIEVILRGLSINGGSTASPGLNGIRYISGKSLRVEDVVIFNSTAGSPNGTGINVGPSSQSHDIVVNNSRIYNNGAPNTGAGIVVNPTGSASVNFIITNSSVDNNDLGIRLRGLSTTGNIKASITDTSTSANTRLGILAEGDASGVVTVQASGVTVTGSQTGISATSPGVVFLGSSVVTGNDVGVAGNVQSYGNNQLNGNTVTGSTTPVGLQSFP